MKNNTIKQMMTVSFSIFFSVAQAEETEMLSVNPQTLWSQPSQEHRLVIEGGLPPIRWQSQAGEITALEEKINVFLYRAPKRYMRDFVRFYDRAGQEIQVNIDVLRPLTISPSVRNVSINDQTHFIVQGGSGQWEVVNNGGLNVNVLQKPMRLNVMTGELVGQKAISIRDTITEEQLEVIVEIYSPLEAHKKITE